MTLPNLIHPVSITVKLLNRSEMLMDNDAREPIRGARETAADVKTLPGQVKWDVENDPASYPGGPRPQSSGYILCRVVDMDAYLGSGIRLKRSDHIVAIGRMTGLDLYIQGDEPCGHYPDQNGVTMFKYHFSDRKPVQTGNLG